MLTHIGHLHAIRCMLCIGSMTSKKTNYLISVNKCISKIVTYPLTDNAEPLE